MHRNAVTVPITVEPTEVRDVFARSSTGHARETGASNSNANRLSKPKRMNSGTVKPSITSDSISNDVGTESNSSCTTVALYHSNEAVRQTTKLKSAT